MEWSCTECGETFGPDDHVKLFCFLPGEGWAWVCTCRPDVLDRATIRLASQDCAWQYAIKHREHAAAICDAIAIAAIAETKISNN